MRKNIATRKFVDRVRAEVEQECDLAGVEQVSYLSAIILVGHRRPARNCWESRTRIFSTSLQSQVNAFWQILSISAMKRADDTDLLMEIAKKCHAERGCVSLT